MSAVGDRLTRMLERFGEAGTLPSDTDEERASKTTLTYAAAIVVLLSPVWVVGYWMLGRPLSAAIPFFYQVVTVAHLSWFLKRKDFASFRLMQHLLWLTLPVLLQWSLGGFAASSAVGLWAALAPLGAVMFYGPSRAVPWFAAFGSLMAGSALIEPRLAPPDPALTEPIRHLYFGLNTVAVPFTAFLMLRYFGRARDRALHALRQEQDRSERLLLNVLPQPIAERLKHDPTAIAESYEEVTVLFADVVEFTPLSASLEPAEVVGWLNEIFTAFDELAGRFGLEKIKTVGDAYMAVAGLPEPRPDHAEAAVGMALAMRRFSEENRSPTGGPLRLRIGLNAGPVIAGVIGRRKFIYDLWGHTVNMASRMESHGMAGEIQVTEEVTRRLGDRYAFRPRGTVDVKGIGPTPTYLLVDRADG